MSKTKSLALILGVFIMSFLVGYLVLAWTEPTAAPPEDNVLAPLNVSTTTQTKDGRLDFTEFYDANDALRRYYVNPSGTTSAILAGNVGIGTTSPVGKLHIGGTAPRWINFGTSGVAAPAVGSSGTKLVLYGSETSNNPRYAMGIASGEFWYSSGGVHKWYTESGGVWASRMTILNNGNVGIGDTTPDYKLDVNGALRLQTSAEPTIAQGVIYFDGTKFKCSENGTSWVDCVGGAAAGQWTLDTTVTPNRLYPNNTAWNVGIGTTGPQAKLDVQGGLISSGERNTVNSWSISNSCGGSWLTGVRSGIWGKDYSTGCGDEWYIAWYPRSGESSTLEIAAKNDGDDHIALMPSGNVGIGATSPEAKLHVSGDTRVDGLIDVRNNNNLGLSPTGLRIKTWAGGNYYGIGMDGSTIWQVSDRYHKWLYTDDGSTYNTGMTLDNNNLNVNGWITASGLDTQGQTCPSGWSCEVNTWDIAAQSAKLYGELRTDGQIIAGGAGGGEHLMINDITGARWTLGTGGYDLTFRNDYNDGIFREKVRFTENGQIIGKLPLATASRSGNTNCNVLGGTVLEATITVDTNSTLLVFSSVANRYTNSSFSGELWIQRDSTNISGYYTSRGFDGHDWKPGAVNAVDSVGPGTYTIRLKCWGEEFSAMGIGSADLIVIAFKQ